MFNTCLKPLPGQPKGLLWTQTSGEIVYRLHGMETMGLYGVNRDSKTVNYFKQIHLPAGVALVTLYGIAVAEIILGLTFLLIFIKSLLPQHKIQKESLYGTRTLHRLAFKGSAAIFLFFATGDILFGDRTELWEHGTFFVMALLSYYLYIQSDSIETEEEKEISQGEQFN
ncbi:MAG TPA: hypothetical protein EYO60_02880 [Candidatus Lambdaproteobacteria bacterium]|nr:hypothetical protein [Candidatus Lambdaproteobacteria bacterium]